MSPLHQFGDLIRELLMKVPLVAVRGLFLLFIGALLIWVLTLPRTQTTPPGTQTGKVRLSDNLKLWAAVSLVLQFLIYSLL